MTNTLDDINKKLERVDDTNVVMQMVNDIVLTVKEDVEVQLKD